MHAEFADWYRIASVELRDVDLNNRWAALEGFAKKADVDALLEVTRLFFGMNLKDPGFADKFRSIFKASDEKFPMIDNDAEVRILAGASLIAALEGRDDRATAAALLLKCTSFFNQRPAPVGDIVRLAREYLSQLSASLRYLEEPRLPQVAKLKTEFEKGVTAVRKAFQEGGTTQACAEPIGTILQSFSKTLASLTEWADTQTSQKELRREESDVLWWLFAGHSRDLELPFADISTETIVLLAAKELADLTRTIPGPYSIRAFLAKAIRESKSVEAKTGGTKQIASLAGSVEECKSDWRKATSSRADLHLIEDFCPVFVALKRCEEANGKPSWRQVFKRVTNLSPTTKIGPLDLAEQAYDEWILARAVEAVSGRL